jgi:ribosomal protein S18 acetylase RimI-like enzyme
VDAWRIDRAGPEAWERVRAIRLRALADAPDAFGTTYEEEVATTPEAWRERLGRTSRTTFVAADGARDVGLIMGGEYDGLPRAAGLYAMWVAPGARGRGIGGALVDAVVDWARRERRSHVLLDVGDANLAAIRLYESRGFRATGVTGVVSPTRPHVLEHQRALDLGP